MSNGVLRCGYEKVFTFSMGVGRNYGTPSATILFYIFLSTRLRSNIRPYKHGGCEYYAPDLSKEPPIRSV